MDDSDSKSGDEIMPDFSSSDSTRTRSSSQDSSSFKDLPIDKCCCGIQVFFINVNQGNFICVKNCRTNKLVIIDAGSSNLSFEGLYIENSKSLEYIFKDCTISAIIITHLDEDHYNYLKDEFFKQFLDDYEIKIPNLIMVCGMSNPNQRALLDKVKIELKTKYSVIPKPRTCIIQPIDDTTTVTDIGITAIEKQINDAFEYPNAFKFCLPTKGIAGKLTKNTCSLVVRLSCEGGNILFTGDATGATWDALKGDPNMEIFRSVNFLVIPHHGAETARSNLWLPHIATSAENNFVGAVVLANPAETKHKHPRYFETCSSWPKTAMRAEKLPVCFRKKGKDEIYEKATHRCIYEPALLPGNILWLKLENGLSIFDNEAFFECGNPRESISPFFTPFITFWNGKWVSVYSCIERLIELAKTDHQLTMCEAINLNLHLQKMLSAHTAPMIATNQYWMDLRDYYERVIAKTPSKEVKQKNSELLEKLRSQFRLPFGEPEQKKPAVSLSTKLPASDSLAASQRIIPPRLDGHCILDVPGDGNCGIWAVLVASGMITPIELANLMTTYGPLQQQYGYSPNWRNPVCQKVLLETSPTAVQKMIDWRAKNKVGEPGDWIGEEHLPQLSEALGKPIVVVYTIDGLPIYTLYSSTERRGKVLEGQTIGQITREHPDAIFIYFDPEHQHFQAIVPHGKP